MGDELYYLPIFGGMFPLWRLIRQFGSFFTPNRSRNREKRTLVSDYVLASLNGLNMISKDLYSAKYSVGSVRNNGPLMHLHLHLWWLIRDFELSVTE